GLMGGVLNARSLGEALRPAWERRLRASGLAGAEIRLPTSGGLLEVHLGDGSLRLAPLTETQFAHVLFHGFDETAAELLGVRADRELLQALFPIQDFVMWPADDF